MELILSEANLTVQEADLAADYIHCVNNIILIVQSVVLLVIGVPGNIWAAFIVRYRSSSDYHLSPYVMAQGFLVIGILLEECPRKAVVGLTGFDYRSVEIDICVFMMTVTTSAHTSTKWLLVLLTFGKIYFTISPQRAAALFSRKKVVASVLLVVALATILETLAMRSLITVDIGKRFSDPRPIRCILHGQGQTYLVHLLLGHSSYVLLVILTLWLYYQFRKGKLWLQSPDSLPSRDQSGFLALMAEERSLIKVRIFTNIYFLVLNSFWIGLAIFASPEPPNIQRLEAEERRTLQIVAGLLSLAGYAGNCMIPAIYQSRAHLGSYLSTCCPPWSTQRASSRLDLLKERKKTRSQYRLQSSRLEIESVL